LLVEKVLSWPGDTYIILALQRWSGESRVSGQSKLLSEILLRERERERENKLFLLKNIKRSRYTVFLNFY
jgi:hypothetical protein